MARVARPALAAIAFATLALAGAASAGMIAGTSTTAPCAAMPATTTTTATATGITTTTEVTAATATIPTTTSTTTYYTTTPACTPAAQPSSTPAAPAVTTSASASTLVITGHGYGHGLGLSQWGAYGYAKHGWDAARILHHYYTGTTIGTRPQTNVRVLLADGTRSVILASASAWQVVDANGTKIALPAGTLTLPASLTVAGQALVSPLTFTPGADPLQVGKVPYRGNLLVVSNGARLQVIDVVGIDAYLDGVVGAEVPQSWPQAALQAQAVAARTYALSQIETVVTASPYDLFADTRSQVYGGIDAESSAVTEAVAATAGQVVLYHGKIATTYFSASSGGRTVSAADWLGTPIPYLVSVADPYDTLSPYHDWGPVLFNAAAAGAELGLKEPLVSIQTVVGPSGHVATATVVGPTGQLTLSGAEVREDLGLRSSWFQVGWLTLTPPPAPVPFGRAFSLSGAARGLTGVSLEARTPSTGWQMVATVKTDGTGAFSVALHPQATTQYRLSTGDVRAALIKVSVVPRVTAALQQDGVAGTVRPALTGAPVALQRQDGSHWTTVATGATTEGGGFTITAPLSPGAYRVRCAPGRGLAPGLSALLTAAQ